MKIRLPNTAAMLGSSPGFRLWLLAQQNKEEVILCRIYPKRGPHGKSNLSPDEITDMLQHVGQEVTSGLLRPVDFLVNEAK
jgi:hypothetical protein